MLSDATAHTFHQNNSNIMNKYTTTAALLCSIFCMQSCNEEQTNTSGSGAPPYITIDKQELRLEDGQKDTLHFTTSEDILSLDSIVFKGAEADAAAEPFRIDTVYASGKDKYTMIVSDKQDRMVYNRRVTMAFYRANAAAPVLESDTFCIYKPFFTDLPVVIASTPDNAEITSKEDWMENVALTIYDEKGLTDYDGNIEIKGRGNSTWTYPKKPYAIKLEEKAEVLGMPKHKRWVLLANYLDKTLIRNHIAFYLAQTEGISLEWTPRGRFVDLVLNGSHRGTYYLCEQIKIDENRVNVHENTPEDIDGGFLMELDVNYDEINKFHTETSQLPVMFKEPDEEDLTEAQFKFVQDYFNKVDELISTRNLAEDKEYETYIDVNTFVDYYFINELTGNSEFSWPKSCYMNKDTGKKLKAGPVWDFDYATYGPSYEPFRKDPSQTPFWWFSKIYTDPDVMQVRRDRWAMLYPSFLKVFDEIERVRALIHKSAEINEKMWPLEGGEVINHDEHLQFDEAVDQLSRKLREQMEWINSNI